MLSHLFGAPGQPESAVRQHLRSCSECAAEAAWLAHAASVVRAGSDPGGSTPECLDDDTVAALAEGALDRAAMAASLPHLVTCSHCRTAIAAVARSLGDPAVAREVAAVKRAGYKRWYRVALPAAAAALLLMLAWPPGATDDRPPVHRAPASMGAAAPVPMSPVGEVAGARILRWASVAEADRYRVTLFDLGGAVLYETLLADTVASLPDSVLIVPGRAYVWKVEARTGWDRWATSEIVEFTVVGGKFR